MDNSLTDLSSVANEIESTPSTGGGYDSGSESTGSGQGNIPPQTSTAPPSDEPLYEVKVGGKVWKVPASELVSGYQRQQDYTKKTMELAHARKQWEEQANQWGTERQQLAQFLQNREAVQQYLRKLQGYEEPNDLMTAEQAQQMMQRQAQQLQSLTQKQIAQAQTESEIRQLQMNYSAEIDRTLQSLLTQHPELQAVKGIEKLIREDVIERGPATIDEAKQAFIAAAKARVDQLRGVFTNQQKQQAVAGAPLRNGIEPPGGSALQPVPKQLYKLGDPQLLADAIRDLEAGNL